MRTRVILPNDGFRIRPFDIDTKERHLSFMNAFPSCNYPPNTMMLAWAIIKLCQISGEWKPFTLKEIEEMYRQHFDWEFSSFGGLVGGTVCDITESLREVSLGKFPIIRSSDFLVLGDDGKYYITCAFVFRCYEWSPVRFANICQEAESIG